MKGKLKAMFTQNIGMKLVSVVIAILVWLSIINLSDPKVTRTISGIPIAQRNEDLVNVENQTYVSDSPKTVSVRIYGVRSQIQDITAEDFIAYVDFREMSSVYAVPVHVELKNTKYAEEVEITKQSLTMYTGKIEERKEKTVNIRVNVTGVPDTHYAYSDGSTKALKIYGSQKTLDTINALVANVDLKGSTSSVSGLEVPLTAVDSKDNEVDITDVQISLSSIFVDIDVYPKRDIEMVVDQSNIKAADGFGIVEVKNTKVAVAGDPTALDALERRGPFVVPYEAVGLMQDKEDYINIANLLPSGVMVADETDTITVSITVSRLTQKIFSVSTATITVRNLDFETLQYSFPNQLFEIPIYDLWLESTPAITDSNLGLYIDLSDITEPGDYTVELHSTHENPNVEYSLTKQKITVPIHIDSAGEDNGRGNEGN